MSVFQAGSHLKLTPPGIGLTVDQMDYLYQLYNEGVLNKKISIHQELPNKATYKYLKDKSGYTGPKVIAFLMSLSDWAKEHKSEDWRNPFYREKVEDDRMQSVKDFLLFPAKIVGSAAKEVADPITKPLIAMSVIAASGAVIYGAFKLGLFKKLARRIKK